MALIWSLFGAKSIGGATGSAREGFHIANTKDCTNISFPCVGEKIFDLSFLGCLVDFFNI